MLLNTGRAAFHWWLRLIVAAFLLTAWIAVGWGSGIAHADDPSSSGGTSSSESSSDPKADKADPPKQAGAPGGDTGGTDTENAATAEATVGDSESPVVDVEPSKPTPVADADPGDEPEPRVRRNEHRPDLTSESAEPVKTISTEPQPAAIRTITPTQRRPTQIAGQSLAAASVAPSSPSASNTPSGASTVHLPEPGQIVGIFTNVGIVVASAVYTVADTVAQAFGPHSFFGAPYALATAVANSAAAVSRTLIGAPLYSTGTGPFPVNYGILDALSFFNPQRPPPGANDPSITVTPEHPLPIILVNGTTATQGTNWGVGAP
ncbi:MAG TPA: hypothetical protein VFH65_25165, partial [Mycobacterium sp.]|nr:hypothetical protein [Mycobacterium sp.]